MKVRPFFATLGYLALLLMVQTATAGELSNGVVGNTLCLNADPREALGTYALIESVLGSGAIEAPSDAVSNPKRPHIISMPGDGFVGPYFSFLANEPNDVNLDLVPISEGGDRSRTEIKLAPSSGGAHHNFKAREGDTFIYTWRFKMNPNMKFSPSFTHLHQIKAFGGDFSSAPLITFTPLSSGQLEVRYMGDGKSESSTYSKLQAISLSGVSGQWLDVREQITFSNTVGRYRLSIIDQQGQQLINIDRSGLELWRKGADHMRPKWGIYRKHHPALNQNSDDIVDFANFAITRGSNPDSTCR
jgi:hypothetical protein